jgi:transcriptional regulator with XRE-family HTH domain
VAGPGRNRRADSRYAEQAGRLAEWLRDRRVQAGMSQEQLAGRAQVAVATVRKIEKGVVIEPGYFTVLALMHALGATREDMAGLRPTTSAAQTATWLPSRPRRTVPRTVAHAGPYPV